MIYTCEVSKDGDWVYDSKLNLVRLATKCECTGILDKRAEVYADKSFNKQYKRVISDKSKQKVFSKKLFSIDIPSGYCSVFYLDNGVLFQSMENFENTLNEDIHIDISMVYNHSRIGSRGIVLEFQNRYRYEFYPCLEFIDLLERAMGNDKRFNLFMWYFGGISGMLTYIQNRSSKLMFLFEGIIPTKAVKVG